MPNPWRIFSRCNKSPDNNFSTWFGLHACLQSNHCGEDNKLFWLAGLDGIGLVTWTEDAVSKNEGQMDAEKISKYLISKCKIFFVH